MAGSDPPLKPSSDSLPDPYDTGKFRAFPSIGTFSRIIQQAAEARTSVDGKPGRVVPKAVQMKLYPPKDTLGDDWTSPEA